MFPGEQVYIHNGVYKGYFGTIVDSPNRVSVFVSLHSAKVLVRRSLVSAVAMSARVPLL